MNTNIVTRSIETRIAGVSFGNRQSTIALLKVGEEVLLIREAENVYDENAIRVYREDGNDLGFIPKELAAKLVSKFDQYGQAVIARIVSIYSGYTPGSMRGVLLRFEIPD